MEKSDCVSASVKKIKVNVEECSSMKEEPIPVKVNQVNFKSPTTEPVLIPEIWDQIFRDFSGNDFISVINTTPEWNHLLGSRKTTQLFPIVLPHVLPFLKTNELLAVRGVQVGSKAAVDRFLEMHGKSNDFFSFRYDYNSAFEKIDMISNNYTLISRSDINKLSTALDLHKKSLSYNPFLTRNLSVSVYSAWNEEEENEIDGPENDVDENESGGEDNESDGEENESEGDDNEVNELEENFVAMKEFLSRYGTHLSQFNLEFIEGVDTSGFSKLSNFLHRLPLIKILQLSEAEEGQQQVEDPDLFRNIELPHLKHLSQLNFRLLTKHSVTTWLIQKYGAQMRTLEVAGNWINYSQRAFNGSLPHLKKLFVDNVGEIVLKILSTVDWPVACLRLKLASSFHKNKELLLSTLSNFKQSLTNLELDLLSYFVSEGKNRKLDKDELNSIRKKEDKVATIIAESAFKQSPRMEKLVVYWKTAAKNDRNVYSIKIVKTQSNDSVEETQYKIIRHTRFYE